jgi:hypothetical protein
MEHTVLIVYDDGEEVVATLRNVGPTRARVFARDALKMPHVESAGVYPGGDLQGKLIAHEGDFPYV